MVPVVVGVGGALGALARYYATEWTRSRLGAELPWGTFAVNVAGSFLLGFFFVWIESRAPSTVTRQLVAIGFLGSFTTFSTFSYETVALARAGEVLRAGGYAASSVLVGIVAVLIGAGAAGVLVRG